MPLPFRSPGTAFSLLPGLLPALLLGHLLLGALPAGASVLAGNGIYTIEIEESDGFACGTWTAETGALHPAGPGNDVLFPLGTSDTTLRSYTSGNSYITGGAPTGCTAICSRTGAPIRQDIVVDGVLTGLELIWVFNDGGTVIQFHQIVNVEGPVDGTETVDNTAIRETHVVRNAGGVDLEIGLRKHWDWDIAFDDGPMFGTCETPDAACDRSLNLTADGSEDGTYPAAYIINEDPAVALCPDGVAPNDPAGCGGAPIYKVAGTVTGDIPLVPAPDAPELLQFNSWPALTTACFEPALSDNSTCGGGDTALAYFYGRTAATALLIQPNQERSFTQYVVAALDECPTIFDPGGLCTPRNHGFWHRYCLGQDAIDPGRFGRGRGPDPRAIDETFAADLIARADAAMAPHGIGACVALDEGPISDKRLAALRELATLHLNLEAKLLSRSCKVELHPVDDSSGLTVGDALALMEARLADGSNRALKEARWIGEHVNNGEALLPE